jgi:hypothetical protein
MSNKKYFKVLESDENFDDFTDFYDKNKPTILKTIIDVFNQFLITRKQKLSILVVGNIQGLEWDTEFHFTRKDTIVLKRDVLSYFEEIEDYDTCCTVRDLYIKLT